MNDKNEMPKSEKEWKKKLTPEQYAVLREKGTEAPFSGKLLHEKRSGVYKCAACGNPLFLSEAKFDSGTGWPSFDQALPGAVENIADDSHGMERTEIVCARCNSHLGHVFDDLPAPRPNSFFVYAILCDNNSIYVGQTNDLQKRWSEHYNGIGAEYLKKHKPLQLIHYEEYTSREKAVKREHDLKTGFGRKWLKREWKAGRTRQAGGRSKTGKRYCLNSVCLDLNTNPF